MSFLLVWLFVWFRVHCFSLDTVTPDLDVGKHHFFHSVFYISTLVLVCYFRFVCSMGGARHGKLLSLDEPFLSFPYRYAFVQNTSLSVIRITLTSMYYYPNIMHIYSSSVGLGLNINGFVHSVLKR